MTLVELKLIQEMLIKPVCPEEDRCDCCKKAKEVNRIVDREINLKTMDPRKG